LIKLQKPALPLVPVVFIVKLEGVIRLKVGALMNPATVMVPVIVGAARIVTGMRNMNSVGSAPPLQKDWRATEF
jgi:hypothetical protein